MQRIKYSKNGTAWSRFEPLHAVLRGKKCLEIFIADFRLTYFVGNDGYNSQSYLSHHHDSQTYIIDDNLFLRLGTQAKLYLRPPLVKGQKVDTVCDFFSMEEAQCISCSQKALFKGRRFEQFQEKPGGCALI